MGPGELDVPHALAFDSRGRLFVADRQNNRLQIFDASGKFVDSWFQFGRPSGFFIDRDDTIYVADSESRDGRTNLGVLTLAQTGYGFNPGARRGIRIGSARNGTVRALHSRPVPVSVSGWVESGRGRGGGQRGERVWRGFSRHGSQVQQALGSPRRRWLPRWRRVFLPRSRRSGRRCGCWCRTA